MMEQGETMVGTQNNNECDICKAKVKQKDKAICCDICLKWIHIECVKINQGNYSAIKRISSICKGFKWLCEGCDRFFGHNDY